LGNAPRYDVVHVASVEAQALLKRFQYLREEFLRVNAGQRSFINLAAPSRGPCGVDYVAVRHDLASFHITIII
jgi:hypothetical protein